MTALQEKIDAGDLWDIDSQDRDGDGRPALSARRLAASTTSPAASGAAWRWPGCCCPSPTCCCWTSPPTTSTPSRVAWLQHHLENFPGCVILVTHDRYFLDQVTKWTLELDRGKGVPYEGNYSGWLEQKDKRVVQEQSESEARQRAMARELEWVRSTPSARQAKSKARLAAYDEMVRASRSASKQTFATIQIPPGPRLGNVVHRGRGPGEGIRRQAPVQGPVVQAAAQRHRRRDRPQRRRQVDPVQADHRPGDARRRHDPPRRDGEAGLRRPEPRRARSEQDRLAGDLRRPRRDEGGQPRDRQPLLRRLVQLQGRRPAEEGRPAVGRRAQPRAPGQDPDRRAAT